MSETKADLVIENGTVLTLDREERIIPRGAIVIREGRIVALAEERELKGKFSAAQTIDARGGIILPGLVNVHTHLAMSIFRGVADDLALSEWLEEHIFPLEARYVNRNSAYWGSLLSLSEMVLSGTTSCCDMYFCEEAAGRAAEKIGVRALIGEGIVAEGREAGANWKAKRTLTQELMEKFRRSRLVTVAVEPHSPYTCSARVLQSAKRFAREHKLPYVIHLAETEKEFNDIKAKTGLTPVAYLDALGVLDQDTLVAHAVWVDKKDIGILKRRGVRIAHCPQSNMKLASGIAPAAAYLKAGLSMGLGTDGAASNNTLDLFREIKTAALLAKVSSRDPRVFSAREAVRAATIGGAQALGKGDEIGSLETGKRADLIVVRTDAPHLTPLYDPYSHLAYCTAGSDVSDVIIDGRLVVRDRRLLALDIEKVEKRVRSIADRIRREKAARPTPNDC